MDDLMWCDLGRGCIVVGACRQVCVACVAVVCIAADELTHASEQMSSLTATAFSALISLHALNTC